MDTVDTQCISSEDGEKCRIQLERLRTFKNHPLQNSGWIRKCSNSVRNAKYGIINP